MTETQKVLTLQEIYEELDKLKFRLLGLAEKLKINDIGITAISYNDVKVRGSYKGDIMLMKVIKKDGTMEEYDAVKQSYDDYKSLAIDKIGEMIENQSVEYCITYFREKLHWKWNAIAKMFNYSERHCKRLYKINKK